MGLNAMSECLERSRRQSAVGKSYREIDDIPGIYLVPEPKPVTKYNHAHAPGGTAEGGQFTPDQGADYIRACSQSFHGTRFWAELKDDDVAQKSYERVFGRKFNPSHDERGRFASGPANEGLTKQGLAGGFTINAFSGHVPKVGWLVSTVGHEKSWSPGEFRAAYIDQYVKDHGAELRMPGHFLGGWHDDETDRMFLDVSDLTTSEAMQRGVDRNQRSIYNIETDTYVRPPSAINLGTKVKANQRH
jgi:hypothetical protein